MLIMMWGQDIRCSTSLQKGVGATNSEQQQRLFKATLLEEGTTSPGIPRLRGGDISSSAVFSAD